MIILIYLVRRLSLLVLFLNTIFKRLTIYNHWALQLRFLNFLLLLFIKSVEVNWFVHIPVITILKICHVHLFRDKLRLPTPWILCLGLNLIIRFLSFDFNIIIISWIIRHGLNGSLLWIVHIWDRLHLCLILNRLHFLRRCDGYRSCFSMRWNRLLLFRLTTKLVFDFKLFLINLAILICLLLSVIFDAIYLFKIFCIFIINYYGFVNLIDFNLVLLLFLQKLRILIFQIDGICILNILILLQFHCVFVYWLLGLVEVHGGIQISVFVDCLRFISFIVDIDWLMLILNILLSKFIDLSLQL
jgi:hypothetical protein